MDGLALELRQAARRLRRSPIFSLAAVLTLALAIGANVAIFAVVERVVLNPLPYPESDRLIKLSHKVRRMSAPFEPMPIGIYFQDVDRARTLAAAAAYQSGETTLTGAGEPERIESTRVTPSLLAVLKVAPADGRWFTEREGTPGAPRVAVLSHGFWLRRFGGDVGVIGRSVLLDSEPTEIVGVMPASFAFPDRAHGRLDCRAAHAGRRLRPVHAHGGRTTRDGATLDQARAELTGLIADLPQAYPGSSLALSLAVEKMSSTAITLKEATIGKVARALWICSPPLRSCF